MKSIVVLKPKKKFNPNQLTDEIASRFGLIRATEKKEGNFYGISILEKPSQIILHIADEVFLDKKEINKIIETHIAEASLIVQHLFILEKFLEDSHKPENQREVLEILAQELKAKYEMVIKSS